MLKQNKECEKDIQRKYMQLQLMKQQLNSMLEEKLLSDQRVTEIIETKQTIEQIKKIKKGQEIWSSLGSGSFIQTDIRDVENVAIGLGAGVVAKKPINEAEEILQKRMNELVDLDNKITTEINRLNDSVSVLEQELQKLVK